MAELFYILEPAAGELPAKITACGLAWDNDPGLDLDRTRRLISLDAATAGELRTREELLADTESAAALEAWERGDYSAIDREQEAVKVAGDADAEFSRIIGV